MAVPASGAQWASSQPFAFSRVRIPSPMAIALAAAVLSLLAPMALPPHGVAAAARAASATDDTSCGTNWRSKKNPPKTIRVYVAQKNAVIVKDFRTYVPKVMASGEFPTYLPSAVLEAGATAVKQYAWYYALAGHHRSNYITSSGVCYDVRNDTNDQLFKPKAKPTAKQQKAVEATWNLTLRKGKQFFLTGYRSGVAAACGADADGWRLYAKSMVDCAEKGWSRQRIQERYYAPRISFVWSGAEPPPGEDVTPPDVQVPEVTPAADQPDPSRVYVTVSWSGEDASGIASYRLQQRIGTSAWQRLDTGDGHATSVTLPTTPGQHYQFRVRARDINSNASKWINAPAFTTRVRQTEGSIYHGNWKVRTVPGAYGGHTTSTSQNGARVAQKFRGTGLGIAAPRGPGMGQARISIDGVPAGVIDLWSEQEQPLGMVFTRTWNVPGRHVVRIEALLSGDRSRIDVDAFVLLH